jgi:hypothetical protein
MTPSLSLQACPPCKHSAWYSPCSVAPLRVEIAILTNSMIKSRHIHYLRRRPETEILFDRAETLSSRRRNKSTPAPPNTGAPKIAPPQVCTLPLTVTELSLNSRTVLAATACNPTASRKRRYQEGGFWLSALICLFLPAVLAPDSCKLL